MNFELLSTTETDGRILSRVRGQDGRSYVVSTSKRFGESMVFSTHAHGGVDDEVASYRGVADHFEALKRFKAERVEDIYRRLPSPWSGREPGRYVRSLTARDGTSVAS